MMTKKIPGRPKKDGCGARSKRHMAQCQTCKELSQVDVYLHLNVCSGSSNRIFQLPQFQNMSCFEIYHSDGVKGLWKMENGKTRVQKQHSLFKELSAYWDGQPFIVTEADTEIENNNEPNDENENVIEIEENENDS